MRRTCRKCGVPVKQSFTLDGNDFCTKSCGCEFSRHRGRYVEKRIMGQKVHVWELCSACHYKPRTKAVAT